MSGSGVVDGGGSLRLVAEHPNAENIIETIGVGRTQWVLLAITGLVFCSDAAEVTFLSFVTEQLRCEWGLTSRQETAITQAVFCGMIVGAPVWGFIADKIGRRPSFLYSSAVICLFGFATALAQDFYSLIAVRAVVGFGVAGLPVGFDVLAESLPVAGRGAFLLYIEYFWTFGSIYVNLCAWLTLQTAGWRVFTLLSALPTLSASIAGYFALPESPRWLIEEGRFGEALAILNHWSKQNGRDHVFKGVTVEDSKGHHEGGIKVLFTHRHLRKSTMLMVLIWIGWGMAYYGIVSLLPRIFAAREAEEAEAAKRRLDSLGTCTVNFNFVDIAGSAFMEVLGVVFALALIDCSGRTWTQFVFYTIGAVMCVVLGFRSLDMNILAVAAGIGRLAQMAGSCATWVHTPELFPTQVRAEAHGVLNLMSKVGAFLAQYLISDEFSQIFCGVVMGSISMAAGIAALMCPETAGSELKDDVSVSTVSDAEESDADDDSSTNEAANGA